MGMVRNRVTRQAGNGAAKTCLRMIDLGRKGCRVDSDLTLGTDFYIHIIFRPLLLLSLLFSLLFLPLFSFLTRLFCPFLFCFYVHLLALISQSSYIPVPVDSSKGGLAQRQSICLVNRRSWVRSPQSPYNYFIFIFPTFISPFHHSAFLPFLSLCFFFFYVLSP